MRQGTRDGDVGPARLANFAGGYGWSSRADFPRFQSIARGSLGELKNLLDLLSRARPIDGESYTQLLGLRERVGRTLMGLLKPVRSTLAPPGRLRLSISCLGGLP